MIYYTFFCLFFAFFFDFIQATVTSSNWIVKLKACPMNLTESGDHIKKIGKSCYMFYSNDSVMSLQDDDENVEFSEQEQIYKVADNPVSWGLNRIDQKNLPLSKNIEFDSIYKGSGVNVYVIDTGVRSTHQEFAVFSNQTKIRSRANQIKNFADQLTTDSEGHGTHVSGTIAGSTCGVAKNATIYGVRVLGVGGTGTTTSVLNGIQWAIEHAGTKPSVFSLSLGGGYSNILNDAVNEASNAGHIVVVAAGNDNRNACMFSPASAGGRAFKTYGVITVAASDITDKRAYFSNYGNCVDIFAPGTTIYSAFKDSDQSYITLDGTSMATPHVSGVAALLLEKNNMNKLAAMDELYKIAVRNKIKQPKYSPNILLQVPSNPNNMIPTPAPTFPPVATFKLCVDTTCTSMFTEAMFGPKLDHNKQYSYPIISEVTDLCNLKVKRPLFKDKVVIVTRGNCDFTTKTFIAGINNASMIIIYNNIPMQTPVAMYPGDEVTTIPTLMVSYEFGKLVASKQGKILQVGIK